MALVFLLVFASLAVAFVSTTFLELRKSDNGAAVASAQLSAESGMAYMGYLLKDLRVPPDANGAVLINEIYTYLSGKFGDMGVSPAPVVAKAGDVVSISQIDVTDLSFSYRFALADPNNPPSCDVTVTGRRGQAVRRLGLRMACVPRRSAVFNYGVASKGKIVINGSAVLAGVNRPQEASVLSTRSEPVAIEAGGHASISGNLFVTGEDLSYVLIKGSVSIGGSSDIDDILNNHVKLDTEDPEFPPVDTAQFVNLPTTTIDGNTDLSGSGHVYENIRIKAGTNPNFPNSTVINGIVYVEAPNKVTFHASTTINGLIVTEDGSSQPLADCQIDFRAQTSAPGVGALPATAAFAAVKQHVGTVILAPGFGLTFRGTTNSINGTIAADQISFRGNSSISGELTGAILGLKDRELNLSGNATIRIRQPDSKTLPAGFRHPMGLAILADSYAELLAGP